MPLSKKLVRRSNELLESIHSWSKKRVETVQVLRGLADELTGHDKNVHVAKVSGSSFSIAGFVLMTTGFGLAPLTVGNFCDPLSCWWSNVRCRWSNCCWFTPRRKPIVKHRSL